ncbi:aldo/keto reductase family oxidoreductase [Shewanella intestini]|uniref:Aldo/keto reductase n=1 Tax=Shewanella intestini TaxID=2017544 RepID=A0ABS5I595_9GAMM|nr:MULTISPECIES: aldo/keto reductase [Shewanella]MBR9728545.1 aldo/keto reductase [Shewanella intestini]MRG36364.1 aldo/keto reductase [Shewanella sp. XMDDZSB0408]
MKNYPIRRYLPHASSIVFGCMGLGGSWNAVAYTAEQVNQANRVIDSALDNGINYFDHADIYTLGKAEQVFGQALKQRNDRDNMIIQTKCGIRFEDEFGPKRYDLSANWITYSVEQSLKRLQTDYIDVLVLHRPDPLMQADEIADAYLRLKQAGKVKFLGVSNMHQHQMQQIQAALSEPLVLNQIEVSLQQHAWLDEGVYAGNVQGKDTNFNAGLVNYCADNHVQIQSWGSLCQGIYSGAPISDQPYGVKQTAQLVAQYAKQYQVSAEAIVIAWLMQHPALIQPVIGTTNIERINACAQAPKVTLTRGQWYGLYVSAKGVALP